jgi:hypothetical protein
MKTLKPTETLDRHIRQNGITTGPRKLEIFKRALALRGTPAMHSQENTEDPTVFVKLFDPAGSWSWLISEWDLDCTAFGLIIGQDQEFGYVDLAELSEVPGALGIGIEVDVWFLPQPLSKAIQAP